MQKKDIRNPLTIVSCLLIGDCRACERVQGRQSMPDFTRGYGFWKDFYDGKCDSAITEADTCHRS